MESLSLYHVLLLALVVAASYAGSYFAIWRKGFAGSLTSAAVLLAISGSLAFLGEHALYQEGWLVLLPLAVGAYFGLSFPCCVPGYRLGPMQVIGFAVVFFHSILDGHIIHEVTSPLLVTLMVAHKFQDGADARLVSGENTVLREVARWAVVLATPLGFFLIPESVVNPLLHSSLFALVIGLNIGSAFHLVKHALHVRALALASA